MWSVRLWPRKRTSMLAVRENSIEHIKGKWEKASMVQFQLWNVAPSNWLSAVQITLGVLGRTRERPWSLNHANTVVLLAVWYPKKRGEKLGKWPCPQHHYTHEDSTSYHCNSINSEYYSLFAPAWPLKRQNNWHRLGLKLTTEFIIIA